MRKISTVFLLLAALFGGLGIVGLTQAASGSATVSTFAGASVYYAGAPGETGWYNPSGVAVSASGDLYVADDGTNLVRKINTATGQASNFVGQDSSATGSPQDIEFDSSGNLYVMDHLDEIWKITPSGVKTSHYKGSSSTFETPSGIAIDPSGNIYVADTNGKVIRKVSPAGNVSVFAGSGSSGSTDGTGVAASFAAPSDVDISSDNSTLYVADRYGYRIRAINISTAVVTTLAGSDSSGVTDGTGSAASFVGPRGLHVEGNTLYVADSTALRSIDLSSGAVTTVAGSASSGFNDATGAAAGFYGARSVAVYGGQAYIAESASARVRKVTLATGATTTFSGVRWGLDGTGSAARFDQIEDITDPSSDGKVWVADSYSLRRLDTTTGAVVTAWTSESGLVGDVVSNPSGTDAYFIYGQSIKKVTSAGIVTDLAGAATTTGYIDGAGAAARFNTPRGLDISIDGTYLLVADEENHRIRKVMVSDGATTTFLGTGTKGHTDGPLASAIISDPIDVAVTPQGVAFVQLPDTFMVSAGSHNAIRFLRNSDNSVVTLLAMSGVSGSFTGSGSSCSAGVCDNGALFIPNSVAYDSVHQVLLAGGYGKILGFTSTPEVFALAGSSAVYRGVPAYKDGSSSSARFTGVSGLSVLADGSILVSDRTSNVVRRLSGVSIDTTVSTTTTVASTTTAPVSSTTPSTTPTTAAPTTTAPPSPVSTLPSYKAPAKGSAVVINKDGSSQPADILPGEDFVSMSSGGFSAIVAPQPSSSGFVSSSFTIKPGRGIKVSGSGFKPGSTVELWLFLNQHCSDRPQCLL